METQKTPNSRRHLPPSSKKSGSVGIIISDFKQYTEPQKQTKHDTGTKQTVETNEIEYPEIR